MTGLTQEIYSVSGWLSYLYKTCTLENKKAPREFQLGPDEFRQFKKERYEETDYQGVPVIPVDVPGVRYWV
jgi:hypothetical protein